MLLPLTLTTKVSLENNFYLTSAHKVVLQVTIRTLGHDFAIMTVGQPNDYSILK